MPTNRLSSKTVETPTVRITAGLSERFAQVLWPTDKGQRSENICDVLDGNVKAPETIARFANEWLFAERPSMKTKKTKTTKPPKGKGKC